MVENKPKMLPCMHVQPNPAIIIIINLVSDYYNGATGWILARLTVPI